MIFALLVFFVGCGEKQEGKKKIEYPPTTNALIIPQQIWDFGAVPENGIVTHHFPLINPHSDTVTIVDFEAECDCTKLPPTPIVIPPGETILLKVTFNSKTYVGPTNRAVGLITDYPSDSLQSIYYASVASQLPVTIKITPLSVAFIPGKKVQKITIENMVVTESKCRILLDNDSLFTVSNDNFTLGRYEKIVIEVSPIRDNVSELPAYSCLTLEVSRKELFRVSIPVKIVEF